MELNQISYFINLAETLGRSAMAHGLVTRPIDGFVLERDIVIATVSGSTAPVEIRKIAHLAAGYEWR